MPECSRNIPLPTEQLDQVPLDSGQLRPLKQENLGVKHYTVY